ncbi:hypothetical protein M8C21_006151 [Ambrosia artemisiifolia]|uniref:Uncharacterized protein n=1 Tax=Ambrosia artemisiifolia TaxID=4212 RepID=A0AAD5CUW2_AMBAR|nr:hypothetical protein M8C21_006151 [Ambrosia artemisiifolia]
MRCAVCQGSGMKLTTQHIVVYHCEARGQITTNASQTTGMAGDEKRIIEEALLLINERILETDGGWHWGCSNALANALGSKVLLLGTADAKDAKN